MAIPDAGAAISTNITVANAPAVLRDIDLTTRIAHPHSGDVRITLTHNGKTVLIKDETSAGGAAPGSANGWIDVWDGTVWDDQADDPATEHLYTDDGVVTPLVAEAALGRFIGDNPNGVWTLTVQDTAATDVGTLKGWSLAIAGVPVAPPLTTTEYANSTPLAIPDNAGPVTRTITVSGARPYLWDVNLQTFLAHQASSDLDVTLSHAGKTVTITTDNGGADVNLFNGTVWDDSAAVAVTADADADTTVPEEAMAAFIGTDPNGVWTISVADDAAADTGSLNSWKLTIQDTAGCAGAPVTPPPPAPTSPPAPPAPAPIVLPPASPPTPGAKLAPRAFAVAVSTKRDRTAPYAFRVSGRLTPPAGTTICSGKVKVTVTAGKKVVSTRRVNLRRAGSACTYAASFRLRSKPRTLPRSGKVTISARYLGTTRVTARTAKPKVVRLG